MRKRREKVRMTSRKEKKQKFVIEIMDKEDIKGERLGRRKSERNEMTASYTESVHIRVKLAGERATGPGAVDVRLEGVAHRVTIHPPPCIEAQGSWVDYAERRLQPAEERIAERPSREKHGSLEAQGLVEASGLGHGHQPSSLLLTQHALHR